MNSEPVEIGDLLKIVSSEIIQPYELMNSESLGGRQLCDINSEYVMARKNKESYNLFGNIILSCTFLAVVVAVIIFAKYNSEIGLNVWLCMRTVIVMAMIGIGTSIGFWHIADKYFLKCEKIAPILETFRSDLEELKWPVGILCKGAFTEGRLKDVFVFHAENILDAKMKLNKVRLEPRLRLSDITRLANLATQYEDAFNKASSVLEKRFGMKFENREIFPEAERRLDRSLGK